jgi:hypothetical protein
MEQIAPSIPPRCQTDEHSLSRFGRLVPQWLLPALPGQLKGAAAAAETRPPVGFQDSRISHFLVQAGESVVSLLLFPPACSPHARCIYVSPTPARASSIVPPSIRSHHQAGPGALTPSAPRWGWTPRRWSRRGRWSTTMATSAPPQPGGFVGWWILLGVGRERDERGQRDLCCGKYCCRDADAVDTSNARTATPEQPACSVAQATRTARTTTYPGTPWASWRARGASRQATWSCSSALAPASRPAPTCGARRGRWRTCRRRGRTGAGSGGGVGGCGGCGVGAGR